MGRALVRVSMVLAGWPVVLFFDYLLNTDPGPWLSEGLEWALSAE